jgi:hypothetical protein
MRSSSLCRRKSSRVGIFVLRADANFGAERHPNSHQRTVALAGTALFEIFVDGA